MRLQDLTKRKWNYAGLSFCLTFFGFIILMIVRGFAPFGSNALLYSDSYHQYYPFFLTLRRAIRSGGSLVYTWQIGMGLDYLGLIAYYLASPLNFLSILLPESWTLAYFSLLIPLKLGLASMFFALFLKKLYGREDLGLTLFSCFYGLCGWALAYQWNTMWLDTFALLPLVVLGMVYLLTERKFILYTLTLFLSVAANYYIGFFTCVFLLLSFICYEVCRWGGFKKFCIDLLLMAVFSILAIGMTLFLELPALAALQTTQSSVNKFPEGFQLNITSDDTFMGLLDAMRQVAGNAHGGLKPSFKEGLPNIYSGLFANAFALLFLLNKNIRVRDKVCAVLLLLFFNVSFIIRQLDYIWHGFHFTNMIPYRFSFLHSFVLLYMAYRAYLLREEFSLWQVITAGVLAIGFAACSDERLDSMYFAYNGAFLLLYLFVLIYPLLFKKLPEDAPDEEKVALREMKAIRMTQCRSFLLIVIVLEIAMNLVNFGIHFTGTSMTFYPRGKEYSASMIRYMHEREWDEPFFRAEVTHTQTLNDGALNNYNGISTFTSSANVKVTEFMKALGYGAKNTYNRYCFEESSPVSNLFLGLKYMLERKGKVEENPYFDDLHHFGDVHLLENNAYLPLGFLAEPELGAFSFQSEEDPFDFQNELFSAATGIEYNVWDHLYGRNVDVSAVGAELSDVTFEGSCSYESGDEGGTVTYRYEADQEGFFCIHLNLSKRNDFKVFLNDTELYAETYSLPQMIAVSQLHPGDVVEVEMECEKNQKGSIAITAAQLQDQVFRDGYRHLSQSTMDLTDFSDTYLTGTVLCNRDGLLYTSIPQNGNWKVTVDGQPVEPVLVGDAMISIPLEKGYHELTFRYFNKAFSFGCIASFLSAGIFGLICLWTRPARKKKGKYAK